MNALANLVNETVPDTLRAVPIPRSISGIGKLSFGDFAKLTVFSAGAVFVGYGVGMASCALYTHVRKCIATKNYKGLISCPGSCCQSQCSIVNPNIAKDKAKVGDSVKVSEMQGDSVTLCRCWRSKNFPYCDGAHNQHNRETGDNVGPVSIKKA